MHAAEVRTPEDLVAKDTCHRREEAIRIDQHLAVLKSGVLAVIEDKTMSIFFYRTDFFISPPTQNTEKYFTLLFSAVFCVANFYQGWRCVY